MADRIHIVLDEAEKERFRAEADRAGVTLSEWLRQAAREKLARRRHRIRLETPEDLTVFFRACDAMAEGGEEAEWEIQRRVIENSIAVGRAIS